MALSFILRLCQIAVFILKRIKSSAEKVSIGLGVGALVRPGIRPASHDLLGFVLGHLVFLHSAIVTKHAATHLVSDYESDYAAECQIED